ncbi:MAG: hypothetical protein Q4A49_04890 [Neisseria sp.]|nr:hypothetical protein [Neisseria sp.]
MFAQGFGKNAFGRLYRNAAGEGGDEGAGNAPKTYSQAELDVAVRKAVDEQVAGLKAKNGEVIGDNKKLKEQLAQFDGIDPEAVRAILKNFADNEEAKLIAEGKVDEVLAKRTERMKAAHDKEIARLQEAAAAAEARADRFTARVLGDAVRAAGVEAGIHKTAFEDALARAQTAFVLSDDGEAAAKDGVFGKDGSPLTLKEWFEGMKEAVPHWFPAPQGAGATGVVRQNGVKNPWSKETWNMTEQGRMYRENPALARSLAAQAGIGID